MKIETQEELVERLQNAPRRPLKDLPEKVITSISLQTDENDVVGVNPSQEEDRNPTIEVSPVIVPNFDPNQREKKLTVKEWNDLLSRIEAIEKTY